MTMLMNKNLLLGAVCASVLTFSLSNSAQAQTLGGVLGTDKHEIIGFGVSDIFLAQSGETITSVHLTDNGAPVFSSDSLDEDGMVPGFIHDFVFTAVQDTFVYTSAALQLSTGAGPALIIPLDMEIWNLGSDVLLASAMLDFGFVPTATESVELFENVTYVIRMSNRFGNGDPGLLGEGPDYTLNVFTPVPVPAAAWLFGTAMIGLFGLRRKSRMAVAA
jgi:hypothetical protein